MNSSRLTLLLGLAAVVGCARAQEREFNLWPLRVERADATGKLESWTAAGPFVFSEPGAEGTTNAGVRPFWVETKDPTGRVRQGTSIYPLFIYSADEQVRSWTFFRLVNQTKRQPGAPVTSDLGTQDSFDVWPFWFSRTSGAAASQYHGLFPIAGSAQNKLGFDRVSWTLFPLYIRSEKHGAVTTSTPWPFVRTTTGTAHGFALWPLYGSVNRPGVSQDAFYLWPLGYHSTSQPNPDDPPGTTATRRVGALPFYALAEGPGYKGETYLWPFFGYTDRTKPQPYHETRWFWPFLVQGRGDHYVNRWGPFYTHSISKGVDKTWIAWPLVRQAQWTERDVAQTKTQIAWIVYWSLEQHSLTHPNAPAAEVTHLWPVFSAWDNGAGRRQFQFPSPLTVFFPQVDKVSQAWTPLFSILRYDQRAPGEERTSLFWNLVTYERRSSAQETEFHFGPLVSVATQPQAGRIALGNGVVGLKRAPGERAWHAFAFDFSPKAATNPVSVRQP